MCSLRYPIEYDDLYYGKRYNYLDTVGWVFNPDYTDTSAPSPCLCLHPDPSGRGDKGGWLCIESV